MSNIFNEDPQPRLLELVKEKNPHLSDLVLSDVVFSDPRSESDVPDRNSSALMTRLSDRSDLAPTQRIYYNRVDLQEWLGAYIGDSYTRSKLEVFGHTSTAIAQGIVRDLDRRFALNWLDQVEAWTALDEDNIARYTSIDLQEESLLVTSNLTIEHEDDQPPVAADGVTYILHGFVNDNDSGDGTVSRFTVWGDSGCGSPQYKLTISENGTEIEPMDFRGLVLRSGRVIAVDMLQLRNEESREDVGWPVIAIGLMQSRLEGGLQNPTSLIQDYRGPHYTELASITEIGSAASQQSIVLNCDPFSPSGYPEHALFLEADFHYEDAPDEVLYLRTRLYVYNPA